MKWDSPYKCMLRDLPKTVICNNCGLEIWQTDVHIHCTRCGNAIGGVVDLTKPFKN